jgi:endonuclease YncB( thermonuclease family)
MLSPILLAIVLFGPVDHLHDGDTFHVQGHRVRLAGIDSPEIGQTCKGHDGTSYDCGDAAREAMVHLIAGRRVRCSGKDIDRYGRPVVTCTADGDALSLNEQMVMRGQAVAYDYGRNVSPYHRDEDMARRAGLGIWSGPFEVPSGWRKERRR